MFLLGFVTFFTGSSIAFLVGLLLVFWTSLRIEFMDGVEPGLLIEWVGWEP